MITKRRLAVSLASVGVAGVAMIPAVANAADASGAEPAVVCTENCTGGGPGEAGLTNALTTLETNPSASDSRAVVVVTDDVTHTRPGRQKPGK